MSKNIETADFNELKEYYDKTLNLDKSTYKSSNDEPTPIDCITEMTSKIPEELWRRQNLSILDPCCGNGNFYIPIMYELTKHHDKRIVLEQILEFNDIHESRLDNVRRVFCGDKYKLQIALDEGFTDLIFNSDVYKLVRLNTHFDNNNDTQEKNRIYEINK
jgi:SAM-dependent methyltransferase